MNNSYILLAIAIVVVVIIIFVFEYSKTTTQEELIVPDTPSLPIVKPRVVKQLKKDGYEDGASWTDVAAASELDPATFTNHQNFVKDVRRFSSGANFTSVTDDNTNLDFVNFVGLRRPEHVHIGAGARQIPDIDESVLKRNKPFRWNSTS